MQGVVPQPEIAPVLREGFVALAQELEDAFMLPFVIFTDAEGRFLAGSSGAVNPVSFKRKLDQLRVR